MRKLTTTLKVLMLVVAFVWPTIGAMAQTLIISEVADPGDVYQGRFVELYNATDATIDLTGWQIRRYSNANTTSGDIDLVGSIASGETFVVANSESDFTTQYGFAPDQSSGTISGNGDDTYELFDGTSVVDIYGSVGTDGSGEAWEYLDSHAERVATIGAGNTTWTAAEWTIAAAGIVDMTPGVHTCDFPGGGTIDPEPTNHVTTFAAAEDDASSITVTWVDNDGAQAADAFLVKASTGAATPPVDGTEEADGALVLNIAHGDQTCTFTGLTAGTAYNFEIYPYTNSGMDIDFKTDGTVPTATATTMAGGTLTWYNLQWPGSGTITVGDGYTVYAQAYEDGVTNAAGAGAGITAWIGYSTEDTNPNTWTNWVEAPYDSDQGNNDQFSTDLGAEITEAGTYYYASRFQFNGGDYMYGGYVENAGGPWDGTTNVSGVLTVKNTPITAPFSETFDADLGNMYTYNVSGTTKEWYHDGGAQAASVNGYNSGDVEEDWMIMPSIDLSAKADLNLSFDTWWNYGSLDATNYLKLMYSEDYTGVGDPSGATWTELTFDYPASNTTWTSSGDIDLSAITGSEVYFALKYAGTSGSYRNWKVDNISVVEAPLLQAPVIADIAITPASPTSSDAISVSADVTDADGTVSTVTLNWGTETGVLSTAINMSSSKGVYVTDTDIPAQVDGTTVYYEVVAEDNDAQTTTSDEMTVEVIDPATTTIPYTETFDTDLGAAYAFSVLGDTKNWYYNGTDAAAKMNGYNSGEDEEDWLILPAVDLSAKANEVISFDSYMDYSFAEDATNYFKLMYSEDYSGTGDPSGATWNELTFTKPSADDAWTGSGDVDLSSIDGASVYFAFKYYYDAGTYATWQVDNISIRVYTPATQLVVTSVTPASPYVGQSFDVVVEAQDGTGLASNVEQDTDVQLNLAVGTGSITGTTTGTITTGTSSFTFSGLTYDAVETIEVNVSATAGMALTTTANESIIINELPAIPNVFISEYIEGSSNNKAIEIYNGTGAELDLTGFSVKKSSNGDGIWSEEYMVDLTGTLDIDDVFVIANASAVAAILDVADVTSNVTYFNGNDAVGLFYNGELIDVVGVPSENIIWSVADSTEATAEHTIVRKYPDVTMGNTDWAASAGTDADNSEWIVYAQDDFSFIGWHGVPPTVPVISNIVMSPQSVTSTDAVSVSADVTDPNGTVATVTLNWGIVSGTLDNAINMTVSTGDTYVTDTDIPAQVDGTVVYYEIVAVDNDAESTTTDEMMYTVSDPSVVSLPYMNGFDDDNLGDMYSYSAVGDQVWETDAFGEPVPCAKMTGFVYPDRFENEDWLITPGLDFSGVTNAYMTFDEAINVIGSVAEEAKVYASTDYTGSGDPSAATWTELAVSGRSTGDSWSFVSVDAYDLSAYAGEATVYIAFTYYSTTTVAGTWELDNVNVVEGIPMFSPEIADITLDPVQPSSSDDILIRATITDADGTIASAVLEWGDMAFSLTSINMVLESGDTWVTETAIPAQDANTALLYKITATDDESNETVTDFETFSIYDPFTGTLPFFEPFHYSLGVMTQQSVVGDNDWYWGVYNSDGYATASGFASGSPVANEDWLITPTLDFSGVTAAALNFSEAINLRGFTDIDVDNMHQVFVSTDYAGDPATATWTELTVTGRNPIENDFTWVDVDEIDLSAYAGESSVYMAWKYQSTDTTNSTWEVDNISITAGNGIANTTVNNLSIYPNPAQNTVIVSGVENISNVQVISLDGKVVLNEQTNNNRIDVSSVNNGMYILRVISGNQVYTTRFVKE